MNAIAQASAGPVSGSKLDNRRVLAALIDLAVVAVGAAVIMAAAGVLGEPPSEMGGGLVLVTLGWALYYYFACESGNGQTLGKRVMKLRVVRTDGSPAGMREIGLRTALRLVDGLFLYLVGLVVMMATGERRGRLGDLAGGTMIVSADTPAAPVQQPMTADPVSRVPIAESGPAFAPVAEQEPQEAEPEPAAAEVEPAAAEVASPALQSLADDVTAVTGAPDREPEPASDGSASGEAVAEKPVAEDAGAGKAVAEDAVAEEPAPAGEALEAEAVDEPAPEAADAQEPAPQATEENEPAPEPTDEHEPAPEAVEQDEPADGQAGDDEPADQEEPVVEALSDEDEADEPAGEPADEPVTVRSVETISAIDLVMDDSRRES